MNLYDKRRIERIVARLIAHGKGLSRYEYRHRRSAIAAEVRTLRNLWAEYVDLTLAG